MLEQHKLVISVREESSDNIRASMDKSYLWLKCCRCKRMEEKMKNDESFWNGEDNCKGT